MGRDPHRLFEQATKVEFVDTDNAAIAAAALPLLIVAAIAQVLDGLQKAVYGAD